MTREYHSKQSAPCWALWQRSSPQMACWSTRGKRLPDTHQPIQTDSIQDGTRRVPSSLLPRRTSLHFLFCFPKFRLSQASQEGMWEEKKSFLNSFLFNRNQKIRPTVFHSSWDAYFVTFYHVEIEMLLIDSM